MVYIIKSFKEREGEIYLSKVINILRGRSKELDFISLS